MQQGVPNFTIVLHDPRVTPLIMTILHVSSAQVYSVIEATIFMIFKTMHNVHFYASWLLNTY